MKKRCKLKEYIPQAYYGMSVPKEDAYAQWMRQQTGPYPELDSIQPIGSQPLPVEVNPNLPNQRLNPYISQQTPNVTQGSMNNRSMNIPVGDIVMGMIGGANALLPEEEPLNTIRPYISRSNNPNPFGNGSKNLYEEGGTVPYQTNTRKKNRITVTEEVPTFLPEPTVELPAYSPPNFQTRTPQQYPLPKAIRWEPLMDNQGQPSAYSPVFGGSWTNQERNSAFSELPTSMGGLPVMLGDQWEDLSYGYSAPTPQPIFAPSNWKKRFSNRFF